MQAKHLRWVGLLTVTAFLAMAWTPTAAAIPDVPCEALPDEVHRECRLAERQADAYQRRACAIALNAAYDVAGEAAWDVVYRACRTI